MTYPSILVPLDHQPACAARTEAALNLARDMGSHVTGVAPIEVLDLRANLRLAAVVATLPALGRDVLREDAARAALAFEIACERAGVHRREALVDETDMSGALSRRGRVNDLLILTQPDPRARDGQAFRSPQVEASILASARPVIVLPYANAVATLATRILVAWDDSHAATRAIADALPLLRRARAVQVLGLDRTVRADAGGASGDVSGVVEWLGRHGVMAQAIQEPTSIPIADALLSRAADLESDLIVMGAFGHSRWRERILGGATRGVLGAMTVPVLLSH